MDITPVFGTVVPGSNPGGSTKTKGFCASEHMNCFMCVQDSKRAALFC